MTDVPWVSGDELLATMSVAAAADAIEAVLRGAAPLPMSPRRAVVETGSGQLLAMPSGGRAAAGAKLVTLQPANPARGLPLIHAVYVLFAGDTLEPAAFLDGAALTRLRTPAVSLVASRALARRDSRRLVVFGAGVQARAHVEAMRAELPLTHVTVVDPTPAAATLVRELEQAGLDAVAGDERAVETADVICTCTTAVEPLFDGRRLPPGVHINAMGSYQPHTREIDEATLVSARVVVEDFGAVLAEAGDLRLPIAAGRYAPDMIAGDLRAAAQGLVTRSDASEITLFKSVGVGWEDLVVAQAAWAAIRAHA
ncbi:MAG TPA: ornithine cyclodeaminase family protein [Solirubrobacter sp.]|nr:ornithine cyclodeaminase family protein [Solirubrobacter sp.]